MPSLIISRDSHFHKIYDLKGKTQIGRSKQNNIVLETAGVSRLHATIATEGPHFFLADEGSTNGTYVDGKRVRRHKLAHGISFRIHDFLFAFVDDLPARNGGADENANPKEQRDGAVPHMEKTLWISPSEEKGQDLQNKLLRLFQMASEFYGAPDDADLGNIILDALFDITAAKRGTIVILQENGKLNVTHAKGFRANDGHPSVSRAIFKNVLDKGVCLHQGFAHKEDARHNAWSHDLKSLLCVPLRSGDRNVGCLYLDHPDHAGIISEVERDLVAAVADLTAEALISGKRPVCGLNNRALHFSRLLKAKGIIASSPLSIKVFQDARTIANYNVSVLIYGETGTGKEVIARYIHSESGRKGKFIGLNCSAISESMFESELFGHEKGAFTGANDQRPGMLELAHQGTLFLDEIGDMPEQLQVKLLRALQEQEVWRVGGREPVKIDVRVISATHKDIKTKRNQLNFRDDFYYRLANVEITSPALRERREDIGPLCDLILEGLSTQHLQGQKQSTLSSKALKMLETYDWPGNIRELQNALLQLALRNSGGTIELRHLKGLQNVFSIPSEPPDSYNGRLSPLADVERAHIIKALKFTKSNKSAAAKILQIDRNRLSRLLKKLGIKESVVVD